MFLVISCSLDPDSRSRLLARAALASLSLLGEAELLDLRETPLPLCDGSACYNAPEVLAANERISRAEGILMACPVYNYDVNAAAKNLLEVTHTAWENKIVGFLLAASGRSSYMSVMSFANSLMLDYRCLILPKFVYATGEAFQAHELVDEDIQKRIDELSATLVRFARALQ